MTELQQLIAILDKSRTGYGLRYDSNGMTAVLIEANNNMCVEFKFKSDGTIDCISAYDEVAG